MVVEHSAWPSPDELERNREALTERLQGVIRAYEARFCLPSDRVAEDLTTGRLRETAEVADWLMTLKAYRTLMCD